MTFPDHVLEVIEQFKSVQNQKSETLNMLTQPSDKVYSDDYMKLWESISNAEKDNEQTQDNNWVLLFIDDIIECRKDAPYHHLNGKDRDKLIQDIHLRTKALKNIYMNYGLNPLLISNEGQFFHGFYTCDDNGDPILEHGIRPKVSISDTLDFFAEHAEEEISESAHRGHITKRNEANRFVRNLGNRNLSRYGNVKYNIVIRAAFVIYGEEYSEPDVKSLIFGRKKRREGSLT